MNSLPNTTPLERAAEQVMARLGSVPVPLSQRRNPDEIKRLTTFAGQTVASDTLHVTLYDDSSDSYTLRSFSVYLDNGIFTA